MTRRRRIHNIQYAIEYVLLRIFVFIAVAAPRGLMLSLGSIIGVWLHRFGLRRKVAEKNLAYVGCWPAEEQARILKQLYRTMGRYGIDFVRSIFRMPPVIIEGLPTAPHDGPKTVGTLLVFGHFGNWEVMFPALARELGPITGVAKPMKNPWVDRWLSKRRSANMLELVSPHHAVRTGLNTLRSGGTFGIAIDQYPGEMGTPCEFLGKVTSTVRTVAGLALKTQARILAACAIMDDDGVYHLTVKELPLPADLPTDKDGILNAIQKQHNDLLSAWIRERPEHWFGWLHRRFKDDIAY